MVLCSCMEAANADYDASILRTVFNLTREWISLCGITGVSERKRSTMPRTKGRNALRIWRRTVCHVAARVRHAFRAIGQREDDWRGETACPSLRLVEACKA